MIRRFNYTGRIRLETQRVRITVQPDPKGLRYFEARLRLEGLRLPSTARVVVEAYRQSAYMRFDFGTVGRIEHHPDTTLRAFYDATSVLFRVKVVGNSPEPGMLLAEADAVHPEHADSPGKDAKSLLHVSSDNLEGEAWRLDIDERPVLKVERQLGNARQWARSPAFVALVLPQVLRRLLTEALTAGIEGDDADDWRADWISFARRIPGLPPPPDTDPDDIEAWVERAAQRFSRQHDLVKRLLRADEVEA